MNLRPFWTHEQRSSYHMYMRIVADVLNTLKRDVNKVLHIPVDWNEKNVMLFMDKLESDFDISDPKQLVEMLNNEGYTLQTTFKEPLWWTEERFKELVSRPVLLYLYQYKSHEQLHTDEVSLLHDTVNRFIAQEHGFSCDMPHKDDDQFRG